MKETLNKITGSKSYSIILGAFIIGLFILLSVYISLPKPLTSTDSHTGIVSGFKVVTKVIDGDTVVVEGGNSVRLLGIDADERGYPCYEQAKQRLEELVLGNKVYLDADVEDQDQYKRYLRYLFIGDENINLRLVKEGFAVARFYPENVEYRDEIINAEKYAKENGIGCKWSGTPAIATSTDTAIKSVTISACDASKYIGQEQTVTGKVVDGYKSKSNTVFLNFGGAYPNQCFVAVIFSSALANFPPNPQIFYEGKTVKIKGVIKEYKGKPEIILNDQSQIEAVN